MKTLLEVNYPSLDLQGKSREGLREGENPIESETPQAAVLTIRFTN